MSDSIPPSLIPGQSSSVAPYVAGVVGLAALIGGLLYWKSSTKPDQAPSAASAAPVVKTSEPVTNFNPPPPPPPKEEDLAPTATAPATGGGPKAAGSAGSSAAAGPCGGKCGDGQSSSALDAAVRSTAQQAQGCYNRALRTGEVSGKLTVSVQVGPNGQVCGASIVNDTVNSGDISSCVLGRFRSRSYPAPTSGCVVLNVPISFSVKQ